MNEVISKVVKYAGLIIDEDIPLFEVLISINEETKKRNSLR